MVEQALGVWCLHASTSLPRNLFILIRVVIKAAFLFQFSLRINPKGKAGWWCNLVEGCKDGCDRRLKHARSSLGGGCLKSQQMFLIASYVPQWDTSCKHYTCICLKWWCFWMRYWPIISVVFQWQQMRTEFWCWYLVITVLNRRRKGARFSKLEAEKNGRDQSFWPSLPTRNDCHCSRKHSRIRMRIL